MDTPKPRVTPKDFFLWLGAMVALYISAVSIILLFHQYIDIWLPDSMRYYGDPYSGPIRFAIASLVVMFPLFIWFIRILHKEIRVTPEKKELWVRRWLVYLTLFIAGLTMAIDVITVVYSYLQGDITTRFILKALVIIAVVGAIFWYFMEEIRGTWERKAKLSIALGSAAFLLVAVSVIGSFFIIGSPETARLMKIDQQRVSDLQTIQWQVVTYWQQKETLPANLAELEDPISGFSVPRDPVTGQHYGYRISTPPYSFELCSDFNVEVKDGMPTNTTRPAMPVSVHTGEDTWDHGVGQTCFERTIDPELYPVFDKPR